MPPQDSISLRPRSYLSFYLSLPLALASAPRRSCLPQVFPETKTNTARNAKERPRTRSHLSTPRIIVYLIVYPVPVVHAAVRASWPFPDLRKAQLMLQLPTTDRPKGSLHPTQLSTLSFRKSGVGAGSDPRIIPLSRKRLKVVRITTMSHATDAYP